MRKALLLLIITIVSQFVHGQTDAIFSSDNTVLVGHCQIEQVNSDHWVVYTKNGKTDSVQAAAILREQVYLSHTELKRFKLENTAEQPQSWPGTYKGHAYPYYSKIASNMTKLKIGSAVMTGVGMISFFIGVDMHKDHNYSNDQKAQYFILGGLVLFNAGFPLYIAGNSKYRNNRDAMERIKHVANITFGTTQDGIGLRFSIN